MVIFMRFCDIALRKWAEVAIGAGLGIVLMVGGYLSHPDLGKYAWLVSVLIIIGMALMFYGLFHSPIRDEDL